MTIATDLVPTQCKLVRICLEFNDGVLARSNVEIDIYNAEDDFLLRHTANIPWTPGEQAAIEGNVADKYAAFKTVNGFTEHVEEDAEWT